MFRRRYATWKHRQPSRIRYALIPAGPRLTAAGLQAQCVLVELRAPTVFA